MKQRLALVLCTLILFFGCENSNEDSGWGVDTIDELHYVAIGASDAVGMGADIDSVEGYVYVIRDQLETFVTDLTFDNLGIVGHTVHQMITDELPEAISLQPNLVTIWAGGNSFTEILDTAYNAPNDSIATLKVTNEITAFSMGLDSLLKTLNASIPGVKIVIANLPDMSKLPAIAEYGQDAVDAGATIIPMLNGAIQTQASKHGAELVNLWAHSDEMLKLDYIADDGFHPGTKGYKFMAEEYMDKIASLYK